jgi:hypothetical protein
MGGWSFATEGNDPAPLPPPFVDHLSHSFFQRKPDASHTCSRIRISHI